MAQINFKTDRIAQVSNDSPWMRSLWAPLLQSAQSKENPQETLKAFVSEQHWRNDDDDEDEWPMVRREAMRYSEDEAEKAMRCGWEALWFYR
jgi:hypothetical protein